MKTYNFNICKYHITVIIERKTYKTAEEKSAEEIKMEEKTAVELMVDPNLILYNYCEEYIESQRGILSEFTIKNYKNIIDNHLGFLMRTYLGDITNEIIQRSFDIEIEKGLNVKTLKGYRSFILKVLTKYRPDFHPNIRVTKETSNEIA